MKVARHTVLTLIGVLAFTALAYASGGEGGEDHGLPWANYGWRILNFVIFIFLLYKFLCIISYYFFLFFWSSFLCSSSASTNSFLSFSFLFLFILF